MQKNFVCGNGTSESFETSEPFREDTNRGEKMRKKLCLRRCQSEKNIFKR